MCWAGKASSGEGAHLSRAWSPIRSTRPGSPRLRGTPIGPSCNEIRSLPPLRAWVALGAATGITDRDYWSVLASRHASSGAADPARQLARVVGSSAVALLRVQLERAGRPSFESSVVVATRPDRAIHHPENHEDDPDDDQDYSNRPQDRDGEQEAENQTDDVAVRFPSAALG